MFDPRRMAPKHLRPYMTRREAEEIYIANPVACFIVGLFLMFAPWVDTWWGWWAIPAVVGGTISWVITSRIMRRVRARMSRERLP